MSDNNEAQPQSILLAIAPSHYCEKARWALDHLKINYREEDHPPIFHSFALKSYGGDKTVPTLITPAGQVLNDSSDILKFADYDKNQLYPEAPPLREKVVELEQYFGKRLGPHTRRIAYYYFFQRPKLLKELSCHGATRKETLLFSLLFPLVKKMLIKAMKISSETVAYSKQVVEEVFQKVEPMIADGRRYLVGDHLTAADISLAALASPVLWPAEHQICPLTDCPQEMGAVIQNFRETLTGQFVLDLYKNERRSHYQWQSKDA